MEEEFVKDDSTTTSNNTKYVSNTNHNPNVTSNNNDDSTTAKATNSDIGTIQAGWKSGLAEAYLMISSDDSINTALHHYGIVVPLDGWYGMSIDLPSEKDDDRGHDEKIKKNSTTKNDGRIGGNNKTDVEANNGSEDNHHGSNDSKQKSSFSLYVQDEQHRQVLPIPFYHMYREKKKKSRTNKNDTSLFVVENGPLCTLEVGKLMYLRKGTAIVIVKNYHPSDHNNKDKDAGVDNGDDVNRDHGLNVSSGPGFGSNKPNDIKKVRWQLIACFNYRPPPPKQQQVTEMVTKVPSSNNNDGMIVTVNDHHVICTHCQRSFKFVHGAMCHAKDSHRRPLTAATTKGGRTMSTKTNHQKLNGMEDSMWTTPLKVIYDDEYMVVIDKPQGMPVMGASPSLCRSDLLMAFVPSPTTTTTTTNNATKTSKSNSATSKCTSTTKGKKLTTETSMATKITATNVVDSTIVDSAALDGKTNDEDNTHDDRNTNIADKQVRKYDNDMTVTTTVPTPTRKEFLKKPIPVHRLDAATGGLLIIAKTKEIEINLKKSFMNHSCQKRYRALVVGKLEIKEEETIARQQEQQQSSSSSLSSSGGGGKIGECRIPISGKEAITTFQVVKTVRINGRNVDRNNLSPSENAVDRDVLEWMTVVDLYPVTGRKRQLREHMKALGHPIFGDNRYGGIVNVRRRNNHSQATTQKQDGGQAEDDDDRSKATSDHLSSRLCLWHMEITLPNPAYLPEEMQVEGRPTSIHEKVTIRMDDEPEWLRYVIKEIENTSNTSI